MTAIAHHFANHRIAWSRALIAVLLIPLALGSPPKMLAGWPAEVSELSGFFLLVAATLWRVWCLIFIGGSKNGELATTGPYSVVRNPLYVGTFLGAVGFGLAIEQPHVALLLAILFFVAYSRVVVREEADLTRIFGERYRYYCAVVPRWIPDWSLYREPQTVVASPSHIRKGMLDAMWFLWAFALWEFVEQLHDKQILPTLF